MNIISHDRIPEGHYNFRAASPVYREYLRSSGLAIIQQPDSPTFGWVRRFPAGFDISKFEKTDIEPAASDLDAIGWRRGMQIWVPWRRMDAPRGWRRLWLPTHFSHMGVAVLDREDYWKKWSERARRARKRFLAHDDIEIREVSHDTFGAAYQQTRVKYWFKEVFIEFHKKMAAIDPTSIRSYVAYQGDTPLCGLAVHDYLRSSVHLVAFTRAEAKHTQAGTGLMDRWFADSFARGIRFHDVDHLKDSWTQWEQRGYTDFKKSFIDCYFTIPESYFRML